MTRTPSPPLFALCALLVALALAPARAATDTGPDFPFSDLKGTRHTLAETRGKVVLLEFWASWCVPCRKGFPFLDDLRSRHQSGGFEVVAVTLETDDDAVHGFVADHPGKFLIGRDPTGRAGELYEVAAMPTTVLLDREGQVVARFEGGTETVHKEVAAAVDALMRGEPVAQMAKTKKRGPMGNLRAWERGYLADPIMSLDGDPLTISMREHIHSSKEAAAGNGGVAGGGCGCN